MNDDCTARDECRAARLLEEAARRGPRYLAASSERAVPAASGGGGRDSRASTSRCRRARCDPAVVLALLDEVGLAGHDGDGRAALLRLRDRRLAARGARGQLARDGVGPERRPRRRHARASRSSRRSRCAGCVDVLGLPAGPQGAFVTGATMANFTALAAARHAVLARAGWNVEADGLFGAPPITVIVGEEAHPTLLKSLGLLGLGRNRVVRVPADRRRAHARRSAAAASTGPTIVCLQAGNINTGAFDPFGEICTAAHARPAPGCTSTARSACGPGVRRSLRRWRAASSSPIPGRPTRTSGSTCPTTAASPSCANPARCPRRWRSPPSTCRRTGAERSPVRFHARAVAARARRRGLGGAALARPLRARRADRAQLPAGAALRRTARGRRLRDPERRRAEPGAGVVRRRRRPRSGSSPRSRPTARAGAAAPSGRDARRCGSASARGRRPTRTSSAA